MNYGSTHLDVTFIESTRLPVNTNGLKERMLVQTELMYHQAHLRNMGSALSLPIAVPRLLVPGRSSDFGHSGVVNMGPASEGDDRVPPDGTGSLEAQPGGLLASGSVLFTGDLTAEGREAVLWLHDWNYLICFPPPPVQSVLTYSFAVGVKVGIWGGHGDGTFLSWLSTGEAANFTGEDIAATNDGYLLARNLTDIPSDGAASALNVKRSLIVDAGDTPAVCLVVGVAAALSPDAAVTFDQADCFICPAASVDPATGLGPRPERGMARYHYQPLPPQTWH
jgi:hypothetical protein